MEMPKDVKRRFLAGRRRLGKQTAVGQPLFDLLPLLKIEMAHPSTFDADRVTRLCVFPHDAQPKVPHRPPRQR